ncbi:hypothetical protein G8V07_14225 [Clostridium botulinum D/C]|uniref:hypothetical protein n=1 Tax=Clostridium botulinum TaxID=1491 RepID=UPI001E2DF66C|nr:hypothetical protein [Clostridium botulinum]MCD3319541.1 hypothetical protein [Clostridium botulinum D/C]MCD3324881.1 hypothetical protein [Clostridium botulinum D/C]MCD3327711.1 hypothetical protein [Clostridium botulinum D/C]
MAFLTEVIDFYQNVDNEEQKMEIFNRFLKMLWNSKCKYRKYNKHIKFNLKGGVLQNPHLCKIFEQYKDIQYPVIQSIYKNTSLESIDYIKIHINNLYAYNFDKDVYYNKEYYTLLYKAKKEYYNTLEHIENININELEEKLKDTYNKASEIKAEYMSKKYDVNWEDYEEYINKCLRKTFNNYKSIEQLQEDGIWEDKFTSANWDEDNHVISYICNCLTGYVRDYINYIILKQKICTKGSRTQYFSFNNVLNQYNIIQLSIGKLYNGIVRFKKISDKEYYKLTKKQREYVNKLKSIINKYSEYIIVQFNEFGIPYLNYGVIAKELKITKYGVTQLNKSIYNKVNSKHKYCINCGKQIKSKSNKTKYCPKCAKEIKLKQTREIAKESMRKLRKKKMLRK